MRQSWKRFLAGILTVVMMGTILPTTAFAALLDNGAEKNQAILAELEEICGSAQEARRYYDLLEQYNLLDEDGRLMESWSITMDGEEVTLEELRAVLEGDYDPEQAVTVDGTVLTLGELDTILQIEDYIAYLRDKYFTDKKWDAERLDNIDDLLKQLRGEGIQLLGAGEDKVFSSGVDHSVIASLECSDSAKLNSEYTFKIKLDKPQRQDVTFFYKVYSGSVKATGEGVGTISKGKSETSITVSVGEGSRMKDCSGAFLVAIDHLTNALFSNGETATSAVVKTENTTTFQWQWEKRVNDWTFVPDNFSADNSPYYYLEEDGKGNPALKVENYTELNTFYEIKKWKNTATKEISISGLPEGEYMAQFNFHRAVFDRQSDKSDAYLDLSSDINRWHGFGFALDGEVGKGADKYAWNGFYSWANDRQAMTGTSYEYGVKNPYVTTQYAMEAECNDGTISYTLSYDPIVGYLQRKNHENQKLFHYYYIPKFREFDGTLYVTDKEVFQDRTVSLSSPQGEFYPGQVVPITMEFSYPVDIEKNKIQLTVNGQTMSPVEAGDSSESFTFLYKVKEQDEAKLSFESLTMGRNWYGSEEHPKNEYNIYTVDGTYEFGDKDHVAVLDTEHPNLENATLRTPDQRLAITGMTANIENPLTHPELVVSLQISDAPELTAWLGGAMRPMENGGFETTTLKATANGTDFYSFTTKEENVTGGTLTARIPLSINTGTGNVTHTAELSLNGALVLGRYASADQPPAKFITQDDVTVSLSVTAKNGGDYDYVQVDGKDTIFAQDEPVIQAGYELKGKDFSFAGSDQLVWSSSNENVAKIDASGKVTPTGASGTVFFLLTARNGGVEGKEVKFQTKELNFGAGLTPFLSIPNNQISAMAGQPVTVYWSSNLCDKNGTAPTTFTVTLKQGEKVIDLNGEEEGTDAIVTGTAQTPAASFTVPGELLSYDYDGSENTYTLTVTSTFQGEAYHAKATISLNSQPAVVTLTPPASFYITDAVDKLPIQWVIQNFDLVEDETNKEEVFRLDILRNGEAVDTGSVQLPKPGSQVQGRFDLPIEDVGATETDPASYRDVYTITVQAKNGTDSTWSYDSFKLYVYDKDALQIMLDGKKADDTVTMSNRQAFKGMPMDKILEKNRDISLSNKMSANYDQYAWTELADQIAWDSSDSEVASINYQQGTLYENIENFTYTSYRPTTDFVLSGLSDGSTKISATHKYTGTLQDVLNVKVETMKDKLYLFQCYPQAETTLTFYEYDANGKVKSKPTEITSTEEGAAAYYAEYGIASHVYCESKSDGNTYLGTFYNDQLVSGEQDATKLALYPCNNLQMRRAAYASLYLKNPDGTPYTGDVMVRGGVYVDGVYQSDAQFAYQDTETVEQSGNQDVKVKLEKDGRLEITMDQTQWNDGKPIPADTSLSYIFEVRAQKSGEDNTELYPLLVSVNANANEDAFIGSGESVVSFRKNTDEGKHPFIALQGLRYSNQGVAYDVLGTTDPIGPNDSLPEANLTTAVMWWGGEKPQGEAPHKVALVTETNRPVAAGSGQFTLSNTAYPFTSMQVTTHSAKLNANTLSGILASGEKTGLALDYYQDGENLTRHETLSFPLSNLLGVGKAEDAPSMRDMLAKLGQSAGTDATKMDGSMSNGDQFVSVALELMAGDSYTTGEDKLFSIQIAPTADPTKFLGFIGLNVGGLKADNVSSDYSNEYKSEFNYTPGLAELKTLAGLKTPLEYGMDKMDDFFKSTKHKGVDNKEFTLGGYYESLIYYDFTAKKWMLQVLEGGFNAGGGLSYDWNFNTWCGPIPFTATLTAGGSAEVSMDALTVQYLDQTDNNYGLGNDFLTQLRLYLYMRFFAGVGFDYSIVAFKLGVFGQVNFDFRFQWLNRPYLEDGNIKNVADGGTDPTLDGQNFKINGEIGLEFLMKLLFISYDTVLASQKFNLLDEDTGEWKTIQANWDANQAAHQDVIDDMVANNSLTVQNVNGQRMLSLNLAPTVEARDYLDSGDRTWGTGFFRSLFSLDDESGLQSLETNTYPYANPVLSDDGEIVAYLHDMDSQNVEDTRVKFSLKDGGTYKKGKRIDNEEGYGDSQLSLAGTKDFAVAAWTRQSTTVKKDAGAQLTTEDQLMMMNGTEVCAAVYTDGGWTTTSLSDNTTPDMAPVVATNGEQAIVAWRAVSTRGEESGNQGFANLTNFDEKDTIVYKTYDGEKWSEQQVLYNGTSGNVKAIVAAMLGDGASAVAYTLDKDGKDETTDDREIAYTVIDQEGEHHPVLATKDSYLDENPQLAAVTFPDKGEQEHFVLGWYAEQSAAVDSADVLNGGTDSSSREEKTSDIRLLSFGETGADQQLLPDSISQAAEDESVSITSNFRFVKNAETINDLSILWVERTEGQMEQIEQTQGTSGKNVLPDSKERDVLKGVKFYTYGEKDELIRFTGAIEVADMGEEPAGEGTLIDWFDAYVSAPETNQIKSVILGTTYGKDGKTVQKQAETVGGETVQYTVPKSTTAMYTAAGQYSDSISVPAVVADYETVRLDSKAQLQFTVENNGIHAINQLEIQVGNTENTYGKDGELNLLPGDSIQLYADYQVPKDKVVDPTYTVTATFDESQGAAGSADSGGGRLKTGSDGTTVTGTVYLDLPDVKITEAEIIKEEKGIRTIQVKLYNQSDAALAESGREVRLGLYQDAGCTVPFVDERDAPIVVTIKDGDALALLDAGGYSTQIDFNAAACMDTGKELPVGGIPVFLKAEVFGQSTDPAVKELVPQGEPIASDNYADVTCDNLKERTGKEVLITSSREVQGSNTVVTVDLQNTMLTQKASGNVIVTALDKDGTVLKQLQSYQSGTAGKGLITLEGEEKKSTSFTFEGITNIADVRVDYTDVKLDQNNANLSGIELDNVSLTYDASSKTYTGSGAKLPNSLLRLHAENPDAMIRVNGQEFHGCQELSFANGENRYEIVVTSPDGQGSNTYYLVVHNDNPSSGGSPSYAVNTDPDVPNGAVTVKPNRAKKGDTVTITAKPDEGYRVGKVAVTDKNGAAVAVTGKEDGVYTFTMPASVVQVTVTFVPESGGWVNPFVDVAEDAWYYDAVQYVNENGLMDGTSPNLFSPNVTTTRGMIVTILYRLEGAPDVTGTNIFTDVDENAWFADAVLWANTNGIVSGYGNGLFGPNNTITREQMAAVLYRYAQYKGYDTAAKADLSGYTDAAQVSDWAVDAIRWANAEGLISGTSPTTLTPKGGATRAQAAAILARFCQNIPEQDEGADEKEDVAH